jgi:antitoxin (DNA-binding transcriptional repressor) of toxin-antitoxin stability system
VKSVPEAAIVSTINLDDVNAHLREIISGLNPGEAMVIVEAGQPLATLTRTGRNRWPCAAGSAKELIGLFESEPVLADARVPWAYNHLTFQTQRGLNHVRCEIEPGYERLLIVWRQDDIEIVKLDLRWVSGIEVQMRNGEDVLIAHFRDEHLLDLVLQLKPNVCMHWGTESHLP